MLNRAIPTAAIEKNRPQTSLVPNLSASPPATRLPTTAPPWKSKRKERAEPTEYPASVITPGSQVLNP